MGLPERGRSQVSLLSRRILGGKRSGTLATIALAVTLSIGLGGCGASNSVAGTSATNCIGVLEKAIAKVPSSYEVVGVREVPARKLRRLRFGASPKATLCLIGFIPKSRAGKHLPVARGTVLVLVYDEHTGAFLGSKKIERHPVRLSHLL